MKQAGDARPGPDHRVHEEVMMDQQLTAAVEGGVATWAVFRVPTGGDLPVHPARA